MVTVVVMVVTANLLLFLPLLLVFFMVTSKPIKEESDLSMTLPGSVSQDESVDIPDEQRIVIDGAGAHLRWRLRRCSRLWYGADHVLGHA